MVSWSLIENRSGKTVDHIKRILEKEEVKNWNGKPKWQATTIQSMLQNEKYKGDAILQKSYTVDFSRKSEQRMKATFSSTTLKKIMKPLLTR